MSEAPGSGWTTVAESLRDVTPTYFARGSRGWLLGALAVALFRAIPDLRYPLGRDQATYCLIGQGLLRGQLLYRDLWDNKPPGIFYLYALVIKLFGPVMWSVGVVDILWLLAISCCLFWFAERYLGAPAAAIAVVFNAAWHCRWGYVHAVQPESFLILFVFLAYFLLLPGKRWSRNAAHRPDAPASDPSPQALGRSVGYVAAGAMLGLAFWMKYNALAFFPAVALLPYLDFRELDREPRRVRWVVSRRDGLARTLVVAAGFVMALASVLGYFVVAGAWPALKEVQLEVLPRYGTMVFEWSVHYGTWILVQTRAFLGPWTEFMLLLTVVIAWARRELSAVAPVVLMAFSGYVSVVMQGRFHPYYFETCFPLFAVFWGYVSVKAYEAFRFGQRAFARRGWRLARGLLWLLLANLVYLPMPREVFRIAEQYQGLADWSRDANRSYAQYPFPHPLDKFPDQMSVIGYLKEQSNPEDEVYVWGTAPLINFLASRPSPSRFVSNLALISPWGPPRWRDELMGALEKTPPRFVVVARHDTIADVSLTQMDSEQCLETFPALQAFLKSHYLAVLNLSDFEIYRRK